MNNIEKKKNNKNKRKLKRTNHVGSNKQPKLSSLHDFTGIVPPPEPRPEHFFQL